MSRPPPDPEYPYRDRTVRVTRCGRICVGRLRFDLSTVFAGQRVGIREVEDHVWRVSFRDYDLGFFDKERDREEPSRIIDVQPAARRGFEWAD